MVGRPRKEVPQVRDSSPIALWRVGEAIMATVRTVIAVCTLAIASSVHAANLAVEDVLGAWQVSDVICSGCQDRRSEEKGTIVRLQADRIDNPLSEDCANAPAYSLLEIVSSKVFLKRVQASWPALGKQRKSLGKTVLYGFITCAGINYMQIAFLSKETAWYPYEGGLVFVLRRAR